MKIFRSPKDETKWITIKKGGRKLARFLCPITLSRPLLQYVKFSELVVFPFFPASQSLLHSLSSRSTLFTQVYLCWTGRCHRLPMVSQECSTLFKHFSLLSLLLFPLTYSPSSLWKRLSRDGMNLWRGRMSMRSKTRTAPLICCKTGFLVCLSLPPLSPRRSFLFSMHPSPFTLTTSF